MKLYIYVTFFFIFPSFLFAQKEITTKWYHDTLDSFFQEQQRINDCYPWDIIETPKKELILGTYDFWGWTVRKLDLNTGNVIWKNGKTPDYPDNSQKMYEYDNMVLRPDGDIEVLGVKSKNNAYSTVLDGNPIRIIYDINTGKEKKIIFKPQPKNILNSIAKPGIVGVFIPKADKDGYYLLNRVRFGAASFSLRTVDTNLVVKDTLTWIYEGKEPNDPLVGSYHSFPPRRINEHIYFFQSVWKSTVDTASYLHYFYKIATDGTVKIKKNVAKSIYYLVRAFAYTNIKDGALIGGTVDTTYNIFKNPSTINPAIVMKIDTNGNRIWQSILVHPEGKPMDVVRTYEDNKRNGYWALAGSINEAAPFLYFIDRMGKSYFVAKITMPNNEEYFFPAGLWGLEDGSLIAAYRYKKAYDDFKYPLSWGITMIEAQKINNLLNFSSAADKIVERVAIYPNPVDMNLTIEFDKPLSGSLQVVNNLGQIVITKTFDNQERESLETSEYPNGIYFVQCLFKNGAVATQKIIVQH